MCTILLPNHEVLCTSLPSAGVGERAPAQRWADMVDDEEEGAWVMPTAPAPAYVMAFMQTRGPPYRRRFFIPRSATVRDLKALIAARDGSDPRTLLLFIKDQMLHDDDALPDVSRKRDSLYLVSQSDEEHRHASTREPTSSPPVHMKYSTILVRFLQSLRWKRFYLLSDQRIRDLKELIAAREAVDADMLILIHDGRRLNGSELLPQADTKDTALRVALADIY